MNISEPLALEIEDAIDSGLKLRESVTIPHRLDRLEIEDAIDSGLISIEGRLRPAAVRHRGGLRFDTPTCGDQPGL